MDQSHEIAGILKDWVVTGHAGGNAYKIGLVLQGYHALVRHFVGDCGGKQTGGGIYVYIGFSSDGGVNAGEAQTTLKRGTKKRFYFHRFHGQTRKFT